MQKRPNIAIGDVMQNETHHQNGVRSSTTLETLSVTQLSGRSLRTKGTLVTAACCSAVGMVDITLLLRVWRLSIHPVFSPARESISFQKPRPSWPHQASRGLDCAGVPGS